MIPDRQPSLQPRASSAVPCTFDVRVVVALTKYGDRNDSYLLLFRPPFSFPSPRFPPLLPLHGRRPYGGTCCMSMTSCAGSHSAKAIQGLGQGGARRGHRGASEGGRLGCRRRIQAVAPKKSHRNSAGEMRYMACLLCAVCCLLFAVCCLLFVCGPLSAVCCLLPAVCRLLFAVCCLLFAVCCVVFGVVRVAVCGVRCQGCVSRVSCCAGLR